MAAARLKKVGKGQYLPLGSILYFGPLSHITEDLWERNVVPFLSDMSDIIYDFVLIGIYTLKLV